MINVWFVYWSPKDYRNKFVARLFENEKPTTETLVSKSYTPIKLTLERKGLVRMERFENDDPVIKEVWL